MNPSGASMLAALVLASMLAPSAHAARIEIPAGRFAPIFGLDAGQKDAEVAAFAIDEAPVTVASFAAWIKSHPEWSREKVARVFADASYLKSWKGRKPAQIQDDRRPVTEVSWYAASAYCEAQGGRLPSVLEWEYVAAADETRFDASHDPVFADRLLSWYSKPFELEKLQQAGLGKPNRYGVRDLHGLVWEWTEDFNSSFATADNRQDGDKSQDFTCGAGATGARRREDYAAFMRYAMRGSLKADYTTANLGFRCAYGSKAPPGTQGDKR